MKMSGPQKTALDLALDGQTSEKKENTIVSVICHYYFLFNR